jgi:HlyD family secretion protein
MNDLDTDRSLRRLQITGYVSIVVMVGIFGAWSVLASTNEAVIAPAVMMTVPMADDRVLEAQVTPQNIGRVRIGQKAHVRFPALNARVSPELGAEVTQISADSSRLDQTSPAFYAVRLRIPAAELAKLDGKKLKPGMPAEAFIQTGARSPIGYLLKPLLDQIAHTFRER